MNSHRSTARSLRAYTLVELMVSTAIIIILLVVLVQIIGQTSATWLYTSSKAEQFREARTAFDVMTRRISQATLNTYWDYDSYAAPKELVRNSELRFVCGPMQAGMNPLDGSRVIPRPTHGIFFQAPFGYVAKVNEEDTTSLHYEGLDSLLNTWGYYLEVNDDQNLRPPFIKTAMVPLRTRYRLMEFMQPTGAMSIYKYTSGQLGQNPGDIGPTAPRNYAGFDWFRDAFNKSGAPGSNTPFGATRVLAENILALFILPKLSTEDAVANLPAARRQTALAPSYYYHSAEIGPAAGETDATLKGLLNSKHQLPPVLQVTMVALDELSAQRVGVTANEDRFGLLSDRVAVNAADFEKDLFYDPNNPGSSSLSLEKRLIDQRLNYRIFTSNVYLRGAKWSRVQTK